MGEKKAATLAALRVEQRLELALYRQAAAQRRAPSDMHRLILEWYFFGHAESLGQEPAEGTNIRASQCDAMR